LLSNPARARLDDGGGGDRAVGGEDLRHAYLAPNDSIHHVSFQLPAASVRLPASSSYLCSLANALISTSTPAGRYSVISASTVCGVGSKMSIRRLCVRSSNCSRDFLSTCGDRSTVHLFFAVGSGIGPASRAPVRLAVSTISPVDWSRILASYAFWWIRILSLNIAIC